jgi:hypothetical protein
MGATTTHLPWSADEFLKVTIAATATVLVGSAAPPSLVPAGPNPFTNECHTPFLEPAVWITDQPLAIAAGAAHSLALKADGSVVAWGLNYAGQTNVPASVTRALAIAANGSYSLALIDDGSVVGWGDGTYGETNIPLSAIHDVVAIAAGGFHGLALRADGSVVGWGGNVCGQINIPAAATDVVAIAAGRLHSLALKSDGTVVAWGFGDYGATDIPPTATNVVAIAAGDHHNLALKADGSVVTWGYDDQFHLLRVPARATNVVAIAARDFISVAVRVDGSVVIWGLDYKGQVTVIPASATNVVGITVGGESYGDFCVALKTDGSVVGWGENDWGQATAPAGLNSPDLTAAVTGEVNTEAVGTYTLTYTATNILGEVGTATRTVAVVDTTPPVLTCPTNLIVELMDTVGATVHFTVTATDLCSGVVLVSSDPPAGSKFPVGTNIVVCTAVDGSGNVAQCNFAITVVGARTVKMNVLAEMTTAAQSQRNPLLDNAIRSLTQSLTAEWWRDELQLNPKPGGRVFAAEREAVLVLRALQQQRHSKISEATLQDWIARLVKVDQLLAVREIEVATDAGASPGQLAGVVEILAQGNKASRDGNYARAISFYERAWSAASHLRYASDRPQRTEAPGNGSSH